MKMHKRVARRRGISLAEVVIALAIIMIVSAATATFLVRAVNAEAKTANTLEHNERMENIIECYQWANGNEFAFSYAMGVLDYDLRSMNMTVAFPACEVPGSIECTCGECGGFSIYLDSIGHDWGEGVETTAPNCETVGAKTYTCKNDLNHTKSEEISALGHDEVHHDAKEPTCTEVGWDAYVTCSRCDYTTYVEIPALGHDYPIEGTGGEVKCTYCPETHTHEWGIDSEGKQVCACGAEKPDGNVEDQDQPGG